MDKATRDALVTVNGTTKFISSTLVSVVWTAVSPAVGFGLAAVLIQVASSGNKGL